MKDKKIKRIGIISKDAYIKRTIDIAKGKYKPAKNEPTIWFESLNSLTQAVSTNNQYD
jgi:predicted transcriptional regulator